MKQPDALIIELQKGNEKAFLEYTAYIPKQFMGLRKFIYAINH
ncbi:MAG: hypothetical protein ACI9M9_000443 [Flavobacteriaceae bacterium]|jgi:hypothetical protein